MYSMQMINLNTGIPSVIVPLNAYSMSEYRVSVEINNPNDMFYRSFNFFDENYHPHMFNIFIKCRHETVGRCYLNSFFTSINFSNPDYNAPEFVSLDLEFTPNEILETTELIIENRRPVEIIRCGISYRPDVKMAICWAKEGF